MARTSLVFCALAGLICAAEASTVTKITKIIQAAKRSLQMPRRLSAEGTCASLAADACVGADGPCPVPEGVCSATDGDIPSDPTGAQFCAALTVLTDFQSCLTTSANADMCADHAAVYGPALNELEGGTVISCVCSDDSITAAFDTMDAATEADGSCKDCVKEADGTGCDICKLDASSQCAKDVGGAVAAIEGGGSECDAMNKAGDAELSDEEAACTADLLVALAPAPATGAAGRAAAPILILLGALAVLQMA